MTIPTYSRIMVPTDGSDYSFSAAEHAVYLAKNLSAKIYAVNVINVDMAFHTGIHYAEGVTELEEAARAATSKIRALCAENGVECEEMIIKGLPADMITHISREANIDLIVMGSIGMSAIERVLIGSVSRKVVKHAHCPVLMIRKR